MTAAVVPRIGQLVRLLGSDRDGERLASLAAIDKTLKSNHLDWHVLADAVERGIIMLKNQRREDRPWQRLAGDCLRFAGYHRLKPVEREFLASMQAWPHEPSSKQWAWLEAIAAAVGARKAAS